MKKQHIISKPKKLSPLCQNNCKICNSNYVELIHKFLIDGKTYREISGYLKKEKNFEVSSASISRHYAKFKEYKKIILQKKLTKEIEIEADELAGHQKSAIRLADLIYEKLLLQFESGSFNVDISDWEKIVKVYHQVLLGKGEGNEGKDLKIIFEQAMSKYGGQQRLRLGFEDNKAPAEPATE